MVENDQSISVASKDRVFFLFTYHIINQLKQDKQNKNLHLNENHFLWTKNKINLSINLFSRFLWFLVNETMTARRRIRMSLQVFCSTFSPQQYFIFWDQWIPPVLVPLLPASPWLDSLDIVIYQLQKPKITNNKRKTTHFQLKWIYAKKTKKKTIEENIPPSKFKSVLCNVVLCCVLNVHLDEYIYIYIFVKMFIISLFYLPYYTWIFVYLLWNILCSEYPILEP